MELLKKVNKYKFFSYLSVILYIGLFYCLYPFIGNTIMILSILPVLFITWNYNLKHGIILQFLLIINRFIALKIFHIDYSGLFLPESIIGTSLNFIIIFGFYYLKILIIRLRIAEKSSEETDKKLRKKVEELIIAKKKTEESDRFKSEFIANMSHEFYTPMNSIIGFTNILQKELSENSIQLEYLEYIKISSNKLLKLIREILDLSNIEAGVINIENKIFNPITLIKDIMKILSAEYVNKDLNIEFNIEENIRDSIISDPVRFRQIMENLLENAFKFTEKGSVIVNINTHNIIKLTDNTKFDIYFEIKDTGIGIPENHKKDIFKVFRQVDGRSTRKYGGAGLGLSISKKLAELLGGTITFKSKEGIGSTFKFQLYNVEMINLKTY
ncbi:MAG: hypothetical protein GXO79_03285 [Chlorobi bacterium]|nr:hypothetical protein [Chlorobiota bacterium]